MSLRIYKVNPGYNFIIRFILLFLILLINSNLIGQDSGYIWIKEFKPGSANLHDETIEKNAILFVDNLAQRNDIELTFLGASDNLKWKQAKQVDEVSKAWDEAKKLERASKLRERYGHGEIGTTEESIRGVKVVWGPKRPDAFKMRSQIDELTQLTDSLRTALMASRREQQQQIAALNDSIGYREPPINMTSIAEISSGYFDWELKSGIFFWSAGSPYDLAAPYAGIVLKREIWSIEFQGGFSPWTISSDIGKQSNAFLMGTFNLCSDYWFDLKIGIFSGWEFLTKSDNWTMKVMGITAGPNIHWKFFNTFLGYNLAKLSTLTEPDRWVQGGIVTLNFKIKIN